LFYLIQFQPGVDLISPFDPGIFFRTDPGSGSAVYKFPQYDYGNLTELI